MILFRYLNYQALRGDTQVIMEQDLHRQSIERFLMKKRLDSDWQNWVRTNVQAGCDKNGMFRIMLDEGFDYDIIKDALNFEPAIPLDQIINPLKTVQAESSGAVVSELPFIANAERQELDGIELYILEDFLDAGECEHIIARTLGCLRPSTITRDDEPDQYFRTSNTCDLGLLDDEVIKKIDLRICAMIGLDPAHSEVLQGQHYEVGQEFKAHTDYFEEDELAEYGGEAGQRSYTVMIYLNDVEEGGETCFTIVNQTVQAKRGRAVIWNNLNPDGSVNHNSMHHACPVKQGNKTVITKWFRTSQGRPVFLREENENIPNHTRLGFEKDTLAKPLFRKIKEFYYKNLENKFEENASCNLIGNIKENVSGSSLVQLPESLNDEIHACLKPVLEVWSGIKLEPTYVYGIRIYHNGAVLDLHRDRIGTHIISAIINVDQDVNTEWPLFIEDNDYRQHEVFLKPGEIVYYEGGRLLHGRPIPLDGRWYANIFCHFKPADS